MARGKGKRLTNIALNRADRGQEMFRHKQSVTGFERVEQAIHDLHALRSGHIDEETRMAAEAFATALLDALTNQDLSRVRVLLPESESFLRASQA